MDALRLCFRVSNGLRLLCELVTGALCVHKSLQDQGVGQIQAQIQGQTSHLLLQLKDFQARHQPNPADNARLQLG